MHHWFYATPGPLPIAAFAGAQRKTLALITRVENAIMHVESLVDYDDSGFTVADLIEDAAEVRNLLAALRFDAPNYLLFRRTDIQTERGKKARTLHDYLDYALSGMTCVLTGDGDIFDRECGAENAAWALRELWRALVKNHAEIEAHEAAQDDKFVCPGHIASNWDAKVCGRCGIHIDSLRPDSAPLIIAA